MRKRVPSMDTRVRGTNVAAVAPVSGAETARRTTRLAVARATRMRWPPFRRMEGPKLAPVPRRRNSPSPRMLARTARGETGASRAGRRPARRTVRRPVEGDPDLLAQRRHLQQVVAPVEEPGGEPPELHAEHDRHALVPPERAELPEVPVAERLRLRAL